MASLMDACRPKAKALHPRILPCAPGPPDTALTRICITTSLIVVALWLAGCISRSADSGTYGPLLPMMQFWPCFTMANSLTPYWMVCLAILLTRPPPTPALIHLHLVPLVAPPRHHSPQSAYAARHLPCLHTFHRLIIFPTCGQGRHPVSQFGSELLLLTSDWHPYHRRIDVLFTDLRIHP
jgi:hypothetical protein